VRILRNSNIIVAPITAFSAPPNAGVASETRVSLPAVHDCPHLVANKLECLRGDGSPQRQGQLPWHVECTNAQPGVVTPFIIIRILIQIKNHFFSWLQFGLLAYGSLYSFNF
jgi:hypothetical protein